MNRIRNLIAISTFSLLLLALPSVASAQWYPGNNDPYYGGGQNRDLRDVARRLKDNARNFERSVDRELRNNRGSGNRSGWGNNNNHLRSLANDFRRAADNFQSRYGNGRNLRNSEDAARRLLDSAYRLDQGLQSARMNNRLRSDFSRMRGDLNMVANTYGYNNRNNRNNRNVDWRNRVPFPLPF
jgi:hypothetical protein